MTRIRAQNVVIIDYGLGNVGSVRNVLRKAGLNQPPRVTAVLEEIGQADKLILPGVGRFDRGMQNLHAAGIAPILKQQFERGVPLLGICLGMQLLADWGDEGACAGLGIIPGRVQRFDFPPELSLKIPHMGWNDVEFTTAHPIARDLEQARFYFVHSYHFCEQHPSSRLATTEYGYTFTSAVQRGSAIGVQFHPEKSHRFGLQLITNFLEL